MSAPEDAAALARRAADRVWGFMGQSRSEAEMLIEAVIAPALAERDARTREEAWAEVKNLRWLRDCLIQERDAAEAQLAESKAEVAAISTALGASRGEGSLLDAIKRVMTTAYNSSANLCSATIRLADTEARVRVLEEAAQAEFSIHRRSPKLVGDRCSCGFGWPCPTKARFAGLLTPTAPEPPAFPCLRCGVDHPRAGCPNNPQGCGVESRYLDASPAPRITQPEEMVLGTCGRLGRAHREKATCDDWKPAHAPHHEGAHMSAPKPKAGQLPCPGKLYPPLVCCAFHQIKTEGWREKP